ncbi:MAG: nucleotidyltransferase domain-containing protein [Candidatus Nanoarchaeia archaeon]|jgi:uncharacterized protein (UPF0332 family)/predicted nucleotidyltransferase|nr:nucleotidyltransferase domain-containing protein [Candidatus Nanoarchaeia archaeon]
MVNNPNSSQDLASNDKLKEMFGKFKESQQGSKQKALEDLNKTLDKVQPTAEKIRDSLLKRHKKEILGAVLTMRPSAPKPGEKPTMTPNLIIVSELRNKSPKEKMTHIAEIEKDGKSMTKTSSLKVTSILLEEIWDFATRGQYDIMRSIVSGRLIHDEGDWIKSLKAVEIHKIKMLKKFEKYVVSYVMAGSLIRGEANSDSDIDVSIVIDDTDVTRTTSNELVLRLRDISAKFARESEREVGIRGKLNIQVWILTRLWEGLRRAEPVFYTTIRDGVPLYDRGMFAPWKLMLKRGLLTPTPESIQKYIKDGKNYLNRIKLKFRDIAIEDLFWSTIFPAQGVLMLLGVPPGSPNHISGQLREHMVKKGHLEEKYVKIWERLHKLRKDVEYGKVKEVKLEVMTKNYNDAVGFVERIEKAYKDIEKKLINSKIKAVKSKSVEDVQLVLKVAGVKASKSGVKNALKSELIAKGLASSKYLDLINSAGNLDSNRSSLTEVESLEFGLDKVRGETIDIINAEKGLNKDRFRILLRYGSGENQRTAHLWLFNTEVFIVKMGSGQAEIVKYEVGKKGVLQNGKSSTLKVLEKKLATFDGAPTQVSTKMISSLKELLDDNLRMFVG